MKQISVNSTSDKTALTNPIILKETTTTRLVFKPQLIKNPHNKNASIKGTFVYQKRKGKDWEDIKDINFNKLKSGEGIFLNLKSSELLKLFKRLQGLYDFFEQEGIPYGEKTYFELDDNLKILLNSSNEDLLEVFNRESSAAPNLLIKLLHWLSEQKNLEEILNHLEALDVVGLQQLSSIAGLSTLKSAYKIWENNKEMDNEQFWQKTLSEYSFVLSQIFSNPIIVIKEQAYLGGKSLMDEGGRYIDFLGINNISKNAVLIEIKKPTSDLLGRKYRGKVYNVSPDLSGAVVQIADYKDTFQKKFMSLYADSNNQIKAIEPRCVIITGNYSKELINNEKRNSFELFRSKITGIEIITFDELFGKVKYLIELMEGDIYPKEDFEEDIPF